MKLSESEKDSSGKLDFYGGDFSAILPFIVFVSGVVIIALSGAPDEKGFWPVLMLSLAIGLLLAKDKNAFSKIVIKGMSQEIVMIMITAWMIASVIGVLMSITGFVEALSWIAAQLHVGSVGFVMLTFAICCIVSLSTGSSFATILICGPILYPAGGLMEAHLPTLAGAIIGGATFGDFIAPISDTTIASALSQKAEIGATVKSRIKYIIPVLVLASILYLVSAWISFVEPTLDSFTLSGSPKGLPMLLVPCLIIYLFLKGKHLLYGLMYGLILGVLIGLTFDLLPLEKLFSLNLENFSAESFVIDGLNRAVGISFFTILLMGLVEALKASGLMSRLVNYASSNSHSVRDSESWISGVAGISVLLTTHSVVAILMVSDFARETGDKMNISPRRRANLLSLVVCTFPFLFPYFIPVILMANMTKTGEEYGIPSVPPLEAGLYNFVAWGLLIMIFVVVLFGFGRRQDNEHLQEDN